MRRFFLVLTLLGLGCGKPSSGDAAPATSSSASASPAGVSSDVAAMIQQNHRDTCAATRAPRVDLAQGQAKEWLEGILDASKGAKYKRVHDFITAHPDYAKLPLPAFPSGVGSVDQCQDEDAKVGLNTTPLLGDMPSMKKLVAWHP